MSAHRASGLPGMAKTPSAQARGALEAKARGFQRQAVNGARMNAESRAGRLRYLTALERTIRRCTGCGGHLLGLQECTTCGRLAAMRRTERTQG